MRGSQISTCQCKAGYNKVDTGNGFVRRCDKDSLDAFEVIIERLEKNLTSSLAQRPSTTSAGGSSFVNADGAAIITSVTEKPPNFMDDFKANRGPQSCKTRVIIQ